MKKEIEELQRALEALANQFYEESGAKMLTVEIRISPWDVTNKIGLEYGDGHSKDAERQRPVPGCGSCKGD